MSPTLLSVLSLAAGTVLICAVAALWLTSIRGVVFLIGIQGGALGTVAAVLGLDAHDAGLMATAAVVVIVKAVIMPILLIKTGAAGPLERETRPVLNVPASLVASAFLIALALGATRGVANFVGTKPGALMPIGIATLMIGLLTLVIRRRPIFQMVGLLLIDNGIALVAFLATAGVPFLIELGVSFDVMLGVVVLTVLALRLRTEFGDLDLDELMELHD